MAQVNIIKQNLIPSNTPTNGATNPIAPVIINYEDLFKEGMTEEAFVAKYQEMLLAVQSGALTTTQGTESTSTEQTTNASLFSESTDFSEIQETAKKYFEALDKDKDGVLNSDEVNGLASRDEDNTSISDDDIDSFVQEFIVPEAETKLGSTEGTDTTAVPETTTVPETGATTQTDSSSDSSNSVNNSEQNNANNEQKEVTVSDLLKDKDEIIRIYDGKISDLEAQKSTLIGESNTDEETKKQYNDAKALYDQNETAIKDNATAISNCENEIFNHESNLSLYKGELSTLKTDTNDEATNSQNLARKSELESLIADLEEKIAAKKEELSTLQTEKSNLEGKRTELQGKVDEIYGKIFQNASPEVQAQLKSIDDNIASLKAEKAEKILEADKTIEAQKTKELELSENTGKLNGELASNLFAKNIVDKAASFLGEGKDRFSTSKNYGWCADFVSYVVKEVGKSLNFTDEQMSALKKHLGASPQKLSVYKNADYYYETRKMSSDDYKNFVTNKLEPGMMVIMKGSGASGQHVGLVSSVNLEKGTITTIEGNHGPKVTYVERKISDMYGFTDTSALLRDMSKV